MAVITPRRRLLITAPLAIILPAGLIVYLGLRGVGLLESQLGTMVDSDSQRHHATIERLLLSEMNRRRYEFGTAFRLWIAEQRQNNQTPRIGKIGERFVLRLPLPFAGFIFCRVDDGDFVFYRRDGITDKDIQASGAQGPTLSAWLQCPPPSDAVVQILTGEIVRPSLTLQVPGEFQFFKFCRRILSSDDYVLGANAFLQFGDDNDHLFTVGFIYDLDCVRREILEPVILDTRSFGGYDYPLEVVTGKENQVIATNAPGEPTRFASGYLPNQLNLSNTIPFWRLRYSNQCGVRRDFWAEEFRRINIPLIFSAVVIMILAVIAYARNLGRELKLADMRSNFVARVSHELRTPLGLIRLFAETLEMERIGNKDRRHEYLHTITRESERLSKLIDNVLDFSKIEAGQRQYRLSLGSITEIIENVTDSMQFHMARNDLELQVRVEPNLPMVRLDREAMAQALWNLLSNAVKYSGDGRVVEVEARQADGEVVLSVRDHGIGIASQEVKRVCQQFYRVDDPRVQERGGSGLGLSVVKHIIEGHNGRLTIDSTPRQGSTFSLCLPIPTRLGTSSTETKESTKA